MAYLYIKKPWGLISHPWLFIPISGIALWVTLFKIKIKVIEINNESHHFSFRKNIKHIGSGMSSGNFEISGKVQESLMTPITNALKNRKKPVESFFEICVIRERFLKSDVSITANPGER